MSGAAGDKTEKATPKRKQDARKKGQVAKSMDLNGSFVLIGGLAAIAIWGDHLVSQCEIAMRNTLALVSTPDVVVQEGVAKLMLETGRSAAFAVAPIALACMLAGVLASIAQVGFKPSAFALKPDPKRLNPLQGAKNIFGPHAVFEAGKSIVKVAVVGGIAAFAVIPALPELAALVGMSPLQLVAQLMDIVMGVAWRAAAAYLVIGIADTVYQRWRHEKQMKMTKDEVKREVKDQDKPEEVRAAIRRRQQQAARARMMAAVPDADVVVTNPTHFSVALSYDGERAAPMVVAKGQDLVAVEIRRIAAEHDVPVVGDPPLARSLHATVEVGQEIPEELYQAVAQLLAFVYRVAGRKVAA
ncbi:MAG: flagellar biosynthesis protein FlhB [Thermoleophilaceae bacterium]